ncbi:MAG TPA: nitrate reductase molybdenum cofactor assembly chaperone [Acetobacteraceae bacterium]
MQSFRILSALLSYPEGELLEALSSFAPVLAEEGLVPAGALDRFIAELASLPELDAQERYVGLFDRNRSLSLHIYEHVHGESRDRGQAMVRLAELYRLHGLEVSAAELPDYLPLFLEFLSQIPPRAARSLLADAAHVLVALRGKLETRGSLYADVIRAAEQLAARAPQPHAVAEVLAALDEGADTLAALDRQWEEEAVRFAASGGTAAADVAACGV